MLWNLARWGRANGYVHPAHECATTRGAIHCPVDLVRLGWAFQTSEVVANAKSLLAKTGWTVQHLRSTCCTGRNLYIVSGLELSGWGVMFVAGVGLLGVGGQCLTKTLRPRTPCPKDPKDFSSLSGESGQSLTMQICLDARSNFLRFWMSWFSCQTNPLRFSQSRAALQALSKSCAQWNPWLRESLRPWRWDHADTRIHRPIFWKW